jgi:hypothetical protein
MKYYTVIKPDEPYYRYFRLDRLNKVCWVCELRAATELPKQDAILYAKRYPGCAVLTYDEHYTELMITRY